MTDFARTHEKKESPYVEKIKVRMRLGKKDCNFIAKTFTLG